MNKNSKIFIAGSRGLVGGAIAKALLKNGYTNQIERTHTQLDLREQDAVRAFFAAEKPEYVFLAAGKVGGIHANATYPAQFIYDNIMMISNIIDAAYHNNCKKLLFLGSSCIYPKFALQPIREESLLTGCLLYTSPSPRDCS